MVVLVWAVVSPFLARLISLASKMQGDSPAVKQLVETFENLQEMIQGLIQRISVAVGQPEILSMLARLLPYLRMIILWGILILIAAGVLLWVMMRLWKDRTRKHLDGEEQSILEYGDIWRMLQAFFRQSWGNLVEGVANAIDLRRRQRARAAARIRQIYAELLDLSEELGCVRAEAQTPLEFMPALEGSFMTVNVELETITSAYLRVRYGQLPESHQEVEAVEMAWRTVSERGKEILVEKQRNKSPQAASNSKGARQVH
jgi:hypothetical protein